MMANTTRKNITFKQDEEKLIKHVETIENFNEYVKALIAADMAKEDVKETEPRVITVDLTTTPAPPRLNRYVVGSPRLG
ncbi:hypothetical protein [Shouchella patagoniensis]|uniref:hypothetical protein n=1 Tax=Shouchella patagoniensis TaxID=228576 RepID=UPI0009949EB1|nr:hypothetical protein [Shouchella patagoniensis]